MKSLSVMIEVRLTRQYFPVVILCKVVLTLESVDEILMSGADPGFFKGWGGGVDNKLISCV